MSACANCVSIDGILGDSAASIERTEAILRAPIPIPSLHRHLLEAKIAELREKQAAIEGMYNQSTMGQIGFPFIIAGAVASVIGLIGTWAWKQREEAQTLEQQTAAYNEMIKNGMDPKEAARLAYGTGGGIGELLNKALLIAAIIAGVVVFVKLT